MGSCNRDTASYSTFVKITNREMSNFRLLSSSIGIMAFFCLVSLSKAQTLDCGQDRLGVARQTGDTWSPDGCNRCRCLTGGRAGCTRRLCQVQAGGSCQEGARWMEKTGGKETECSCSKGSTMCEVAAARGEPVLLCGVDPTSEDTESSGEAELEVTSSPVDEDTPSVPEEGVTTTIMPDAVVTLLTTVRPRAQDEDQTEQPEDAEDEKPEEEGTTLAPEDAGMHEFDCSEFTDAELAFADPNQIPLQCRLRPKEGGEPKTVYILIPKQGLDLTRLFDKNVKVVVKDLMIMDISPK